MVSSASGPQPHPNFVGVCGEALLGDGYREMARAAEGGEEVKDWSLDTPRLSTSRTGGTRVGARRVPVSGLTRTSASRQPLHACDSHAQRTRSAAVRRSREGRERFRTAS